MSNKDNFRVTNGITPEKENQKTITREDIPELLDIAYEQADRGECLAAVHTFLQAVEIEPKVMMSSRAWLSIASVVTGDVDVLPRHPKNWIKLPKELVPDRVRAQLSRLPNDSLLPGYPGPYIEPPNETEIRELIADLRKILRRYAGTNSVTVPTNDSASDIPKELSETKPSDTTKWEISTGDEIDNQAIQLGFIHSGEGSAAARLTPDKPPNDPKLLISGSITCHGCATTIPFERVVYWGLFGSADYIKCPSCESQISVGMSTEQVNGRESLFIWTCVFTQPVNRPIKQLRILQLSILND